MRAWLILSVVLLSVTGAAVWLHGLQSEPRVRQTSDVTSYGRRAGVAPGTTDTATFAAGCFWKLEHAIRRTDGVISTTSGYTGGWSDASGHAAVSTGRTGHVEAVRVVFDRSRVSYEQLLKVFWASHDPTRFGPDEGEMCGDVRKRPPGQSIIFYHDDAQRAAAAASRTRLDSSGRFAGAVPTQVLPAAPFHRAEPEHQQYLEKHGRGSACRFD